MIMVDGHIIEYNDSLTFSIKDTSQPYSHWM